DEWTRNNFALPKSATEILYEQTADNFTKQIRLIEHVRTLYRQDDLTAFLPLGEVEPLALPGESYKLAFTPGLLTQVFQRDGQTLLPNPATILGGQGADRGSYVVSQDLKAAGDFPNTDPDDHWWISSGRVFYSVGKNNSAQVERDYAENHFFLPHRFLDPFGQTTSIQFDGYALQTLETTDPLGNKVTAGERDSNNNITSKIDYRVL
ncbi:MAG: hypothetical protein GY794_11100, partial [bacterium]|nr:hypothetical protein [bacterium]